MEQSPDINAIRVKLQWTQEKMAEALGIDRSTVAHYEAGRVIPGPVRKLLARLVDEMGIAA